MLELNVKNMTCAHCVSAVTGAVKALDPEAEVRVDLAGKRVYIEGKGSAEQMIGALEAAGYPAVPGVEPAPAAATPKSCCGCGRQE